MSEDIKMADVFDLPVQSGADGCVYDLHYSRICTSGKNSNQIAHAINNHDTLTQQVAELRAVLSELIDKASECDSWESFPSQYLDEANKALREGQ